MRTKLLLAGDVMTSRGIDQVMPYPCPPQLIEPGINKLGPGDVALASAVTDIRSRRRQGDIVVVSLHWGANWVGPVPALHRRIAHQLIEAGAADLVHGHSARSDLVCLYAATLEDSGNLRDLEVRPYRIRRFRLCRMNDEEREWLRDFLNRRSQPFHTRFVSAARQHWHLAWQGDTSAGSLGRSPYGSAQAQVLNLLV
jgi:poly-gamma-glutamate capsule biosynthesis protein CapA/YwtB (metallophosphatase superfamily)